MHNDPFDIEDASNGGDDPSEEPQDGGEIEDWGTADADLDITDPLGPLSEDAQDGGEIED